MVVLLVANIFVAEEIPVGKQGLRLDWPLVLVHDYIEGMTLDLVGKWVSI